MILALGVRNSLAPGVCRRRVFLSITLRTPHQNNTKGKRAQKRKQPNTHVPRPDPARNHPSRPRPRQTPSHSSQTKPHPHNTPHHNPPHQTHKHKNQTKNTKRGQGGIEEMRRKEKRRGEGKKRRRKERGKNTKRGQGGIEPPTSSTLRRNHTTRPLSRVDGIARTRI